MCGRFAQYSSRETIRKFFDISTITCEIRPSYNIAPTHEVLAIIHHNDNRLGMLRWGLVPSWAKDLSGAARLINARAETLAEKPSFRKAFIQRRCLVLADGFYEWKKQDKHRQPWYFTLPSEDPFAFAGIWETWKNNQGTAYNSCAIITTEACESVHEIHHRMPVILRSEAVESWLAPEIRDTEQLKTILQEGHVRKMKSYPVSSLVNSVNNNNPACIENL